MKSLPQKLIWRLVYNGQSIGMCSKDEQITNLEIVIKTKEW